MPFALYHFVALFINLFQINSFSGRLIAIVVSATINFPQHPSGLIALKDDISSHLFSLHLGLT